MARKRGFNKGIITPNMQEVGAEYANYQYQIEENIEHKEGKKTSKRYRLFENSLLKLILSNFKWYGLKEYEVSFIENALLNEGMVCAVHSTFDISEQTPDAIMFGRYGAHETITERDFYGNPIACTCSGKNGKILRANNQNDFVIGFDTCANEMSQLLVSPLRSHLRNLALELDDAYSAWKVACETRKLGMVFECDDKTTAEILRRTLTMVSENKPFIIVEGGISNNTRTVFAPPNNSALSEYHMNFMNVWGSVMDLLGLENNSQNKRERLVVSEAEMNRSLSRYLAGDRLRARKNFVDEMNEKFSTNIKVENYLASIVTETPEGANIEGTTMIGGENND